MDYAKKYGFTPEQAKIIIEHESKLGVYDGRFEKDIVEQAEAIEKEVESKETVEPKRKSGKPPKGGK